MAIGARLEKYPYTYLRTKFMKNALFSKTDYDKILKMKHGEIGKYLQDFEYRKEVDELAMSYKGAELIERALQMNLANKFTKLIKISPSELGLLIKIYLKRYDIYNIKTILRSKFSNLSLEETNRSMSPVSTEKKALFEKLISQKNVEDAIAAIDFIEEKDLRQALENFKASKSLVSIENALDKHYFNYVISQLRCLSTEGRLYRKFLMNEIDVLNIKSILRMKKENLPEQQIKEMIFSFGNLKKPLIDSLIKLNFNGILKQLESTAFGDALKKYAKEPDRINFTELEISLDRLLLEQSKKLARQHPMSVDVILGYLFLKDIEVKNIARIIKAKQLGLSEEFIEKVIVV